MSQCLRFLIVTVYIVRCFSVMKQASGVNVTCFVDTEHDIPLLMTFGVVLYKISILLLITVIELFVNVVA